MKGLLVFLSTLALATLPAGADAFWSDGFEMYAPGTALHGVGGWEGWLNNPFYTGYVSDLHAHGYGSNSCEIQREADLVHRYSDEQGCFQYITWMYIPEEFHGRTYFILLNTYGVTSNWSVQVSFEDGRVVNDGVTGGSLPWILGEWVELRVWIDLYGDYVEFYYDDVMLYTGTWTQEVSGGGVCELAAVDLFSDGGTAVYYDDMWIAYPVAIEHQTWGGVKALFD